MFTRENEAISLASEMSGEVIRRSHGLGKELNNSDIRERKGIGMRDEKSSFGYLNPI